MKIPRFFTRTHRDPYFGLAFESRTVRINEAGGAPLFSAQVTVPQHWSDTAASLLASKYLFTGGTTLETDAKMAFDRLAGAWRKQGLRRGLFENSHDADAFYDEMRWMLVHQVGSPNSPQWFNTGLFDAYGAEAPAPGHFWVDDDGRARPVDNAYEHPQTHACFIQSIEDTLVGPGGIMDLWAREARLFKYGAGTGTNFSKLRALGEALNSAGVSSGLMSFLKVGDASAAAIRSGGTTRRAAKMVCVDVDHPDIEAFIGWKAREERKVAALIAGSHRYRALVDKLKATDSFSNTALKGLASEGVSENYVRHAADALAGGWSPPEFELFDSDWRSEAYRTVSGQNSNNSVRVPDEFMQAVNKNTSWALKARRDGATVRTVSARSLWDQLALAAWECADPGVQFSSTINDWHTCPQDGSILASNPCAEYLFLDDTGCNLASLNLVAFLRGREFDVEAFEHAVRLWVMTLELSVSMAGYPSEAIAVRSHQYRTLGLGFANLGGLLMRLGLPYSSSEGRAWAASISALMTGQAYAVSAEMAALWGPFEAYVRNQSDVLRVLGKHQAALLGWIKDASQASADVPAPLLLSAQRAWELALEGVGRHGVRNAQVTAIAPTGTIGLVMDCDTLGIEPEFALVKYKKLAGGGQIRIVNRSVRFALEGLGYATEKIKGIEDYIHSNGTLEGAPGLSPDHLPLFDCATTGGTGTRALTPEAQVEMVAAVQPFVSGGISKTVNVAANTTPSQIASLFSLAWERGVKALSVYRYGSKLSQPLGRIEEKEGPSCMECG